MARPRSTAWLLVGLLAAGLTTAAAAADPDTLPRPRSVTPPDARAGIPTLLGPDVKLIDLCSALRLAGVQNPEILLARERVVEAVAERQYAAAQILPTLNNGGNYDAHTGPLQRAVGAITKVHRESLYLGLGAGAVGAGTVTIPGLVLSGNVSEGIFADLVARRVVRQRQFASVAIRNQTLLYVATAYLELLRAEGRCAVAVQTRDEAAEVARVTYEYARTGEGRPADADRAAAVLQERNADVLQAESDMLTASARLCELLGLDPSLRLLATDGWVVPAPLVPDPIPLPQLLAIAMTQRPELRERQAAIRAALLALDGAKVLPFSPNVILGYSAGTFGGGSNLASEGIAQANGTVVREPRFDSFAGRSDFDAVVYWSLRNLGVGNLALIRLSASHLRSEQLRQIEVLDRVRAEVAIAYARTHATYAQIETAERAVRSSQSGFRRDLLRTRNNEGLPIETLDSLRLLGQSRFAYLDAIIDYNRAQFELYAALGQPPANCLARPVPADLVPPSALCPPAPPRKDG
jgi:outer membrane protein TolC